MDLAWLAAFVTTHFAPPAVRGRGAALQAGSGVALLRTAGMVAATTLHRR